GAKSFAIGGVFATNTIRGATDARSRIRADVLNSELSSAGGGIEISAQSTGTIDAGMEAVSVAIGASAGNSTTLSLGGSLAFNDIQRSTSAGAENSVKLDALGGGSLAVTAADSSTIRA